MGGNMLGIGNNYKLTSEFNFFGDPEAAKCVLDNFSQHVSFCGRRKIDWFLVDLKVFLLSVKQQ